MYFVSLYFNYFFCFYLQRNNKLITLKWAQRAATKQQKKQKNKQETKAKMQIVEKKNNNKKNWKMIVAQAGNFTPSPHAFCI